MRRAPAVLALAALAPLACARPPDASGRDLDAGAGGDAGAAAPVTIVLLGASLRPRTSTWSVNYWDWMPTWGSPLVGSEAAIRALSPTYLRVGGYNNDASTPDAFDEAELDRMVAYAHAVGATPILQVPILAETPGGGRATPAHAAALLQYANQVRGYGIVYVSIGNEPDMYADQGAIVGYTPADYCASATEFVAALRAVDAQIRIVGPDLAWKYHTGGDDWLSPILAGCGTLFDVIAVHRYPFDARHATLAAAQADVTAFQAALAEWRAIAATAGLGDRPLAVTETNIAYDATAPGAALDASPGTVGAALWTADMLGVALERGLWTTAFFAISDPDAWSLGLLGLPPLSRARPAYHALALYAEHFGPTLLDAVSVPPGLGVHASRNRADDGLQIIVVNWTGAPRDVAVRMAEASAGDPVPIVRLPPLSVNALELSDRRGGALFSYGAAEQAAGTGPTRSTVAARAPRP